MTDTPKYTPGPWCLDVEPSDDGTFFVQTPEGRDGQCIAEVYNQTTPDTVANARLIAAAPELYEALRSLLAEVEADREAEDPQARTQMEWEDAPLAAARAALAKAEGRINE